jgi:hypothetical protein
LLGHDHLLWALAPARKIAHSAPGSGVCPAETLVIEPVFERRFDDLEKRREIEVGRRLEAVVADVQDLLAQAFRREHKT